MKLYVPSIFLAVKAIIGQNPSEARLLSKDDKESTKTSPNIIVFIVDDLGFNQVGFHANPAGNNEVHTPHIDGYAKNGIIMDRGYFSPWCAPSRAGFMAGTTYSFNQANDNDLYTFDEEIGFAAGIPAGFSSIAHGLKNANPNYHTSYAGKWGIGGTAWMNTPAGIGFDESRVFWGDSIEACDGWVPQSSTPGTEGAVMRSLQGYFEQFPVTSEKNQWCDIIQSVPSETLTDFEKDIACNTIPRTPPKLIDYDLMDYARGVISGHDFNKGPLFHVHATQIAHLPMRYPSWYDDNPIPENPTPDYFKTGAIKPAGNNTINRLKTNNLLRFLDDLFDDLMSSIKDAGQWENTIVLFTSDNGGAVYPNGQVNQNYPLRGAKRGNFDGGLRVAQFLTGGWVEKQIRGKTDSHSDTFTFFIDWAPTFVGIAGGDSQKDLFQAALKGADTEGPAYGKEMWTYIRNSVMGGDHQLPRRVIYTPNLQFEVDHNKTLKFFYTRGIKQLYFGKWEPIWPSGSQNVPDFSSVSVNPCRKSREEPYHCCVLDVANDPEEDQPIEADDAMCDLMLKETSESWINGVSELCGMKPQFKALCNNKTNAALPLAHGVWQAVYSLWTWQNGAGPFTNATGYPITNYQGPWPNPPGSTVDFSGTIPQPFLPKCACLYLDDGIEEYEVDAFIPTVQTPSVCVRSRDYPGNQFLVSCSGGFTRTPMKGWLEDFASAGVNRTLMAEMASIERRNGTSAIPLALFIAILHDLNFRENFGTWADLAKWPYVAPALDSCPAKSVTIIPVSLTAKAPWNFNVGTTTSRVAGTSLYNPYNATHCWCVALVNPLLYDYLEFARDGSWIKMRNGTSEGDPEVYIYPWTNDECETSCVSTNGDGIGTAYIGPGTDYRGILF